MQLQGHKDTIQFLSRVDKITIHMNWSNLWKGYELCQAGSLSRRSRKHIELY